MYSKICFIRRSDPSLFCNFQLLFEEMVWLCYRETYASFFFSIFLWRRLFFGFFFSVTSDWWKVLPISAYDQTNSVIDSFKFLRFGLAECDGKGEDNDLIGFLSTFIALRFLKLRRDRYVMLPCEFICSKSIKRFTSRVCIE